jgi:hypothetical protein
MTDDDDGIAGWDIDIENLLAWDKQINEHEHNANLIRWLYGKAMLASRRPAAVTQGCPARDARRHRQQPP